MLCPNCGHENVPGTDECAHCNQDLTYLDQPSVVADSPVERALLEEPVRVLNPATPICVSSETPLRDVIQTLIDKQIGCVLVTEGPDLVGIFTERDLLMNIAGRETELANDPIREWMTPDPESVEEDDSIAFVIHKMDIGGYRHLPVVEAGRPKGIISVRDVVRHLTTYLSPAVS